MKKQTLVMLWTSIILLIVVACVGIYIKQNIEEGIKKNGIEIVGCATSDVESYGVLKKGFGYIIFNDDGTWRLKDNDVAVLDENNVTSLISAVSGIKATGVISEKEFKQFEPNEETEISIALKSGEKIKISFIGEKGELSAFRVEGDKKIYTMYSSTRNILTPSVDSLRHFDLFEHVTNAGEFPDFYEYINYNGEKVVVRMKTNYEISKSDANRYIMTEPYARSVDDEKFEQQILVKVQTLKVDGFINDNPKSFEPYGLGEDKRATLTLGCGHRRETVYFGRHEGNMVYAKRSDSDSVVAISAEQLSFLNIEPFFILEGGILKSEVDKIRSISIWTKGGQYEIARRRDGEKFRYFINGNAASEEIYKEITEDLGDVSVMNELNEAPEDMREIVIRVSYDSNQGPQTISLTTINEKKYAAFINGKAEFAIDKGAIDLVIEHIADVSANPMKLTNNGVE